MCVGSNPLLTLALSTALGPSLQPQHSTHSQEDSPTQSPRSTGMETRAGGRGDLCAQTGKMIPELSPAALRAPPGYVCPDPRMTLEVKDP